MLALHWKRVLLEAARAHDRDRAPLTYAGEQLPQLLLMKMQYQSQPKRPRAPAPAPCLGLGCTP